MKVKGFVGGNSKEESASGKNKEAKSTLKGGDSDRINPIDWINRTSMRDIKAKIARMEEKGLFEEV